MNEFIAYLESARFWSSVVTVVFFCIVWKLVSHTAHNFAKKERYIHLPEGRQRYLKTIYRIFKVILSVLLILMLLQINGINVSSLVAGLGLTSIVAAYAMQDVLKDALMGLDLIADNFFSVGDVIKFETIDGKGTMAKVISFNIKDTKLQDIQTNNIFTICNRNISEVEIVSDWLDVLIPAPYEIPYSRIQSVFAAIVQKAEELQDVKSAEFKGLQSFEDSCIQYKLRAICPPQSHPQIRRNIHAIVMEVYEQEGISIPYPQIVVHQATPEE